MKRLVRTIVSLLILSCGADCASAAGPGCVVPKTSESGEVLVTRFLPAPLPRAHEAVADAMQALGVFLITDTEQLVAGERTRERIAVLGLAHGDEAIRAELAALSQNGKAGTQVRVETHRGNNKKGAPKHAWSAEVLDQAACLISLLSLDDPLHRPKTGPADGPEVQLGDSTQLAVRSRRFFYESDLKPNKVVAFETAADTVINNWVAIPAGSLVVASVEQASDIGEFDRGAKGQLQFKYLLLPDGTGLALRGVLDLRGKGADFNKLQKGLLVATSVATRLDFVGGTGSGFAVPAGTLFHAEVNGEQKFRVSRASAATKDQ